MQTGFITQLTPVLADRPVNLFSDLMVHHMGPGLADDIIQGAAGPDEFRTVPLWGVGQRIFFLHDGRTSDLQQAILAHAATPGDREGREDFPLLLLRGREPVLNQGQPLRSGIRW